MRKGHGSKPCQPGNQGVANCKYIKVEVLRNDLRICCYVGMSSCSKSIHVMLCSALKELKATRLSRQLL
jgi:hypothetical protein